MKKVVTETVCPNDMHPTVVREPAMGQLEQDPVRVAKIFGSTLQHLGGDPSYQPPPGFVNELLAYFPSCPAPAALEAIPYVSWTAFAARLKHSKPSKSGGGYRTNHYLLHLAPEPIENFFHRVLNRFLSSPITHHWLGSHICLLYKRGDPYQSTNYRPIALLNTVYKLVATFTCRHLQHQTLKHSLLSPIKHGGLPRHQCPDHIYHLKSLCARSKSSYSLYINFNKAFNSVPLSTLWTVLEHSNLSRAAITSVKNLYVSPLDAPIINGHYRHSYVQARGLGQGCPLSPLLFILYLNALFFYFLATTPPPDQGRVTSHRAFIDDILIRSEDRSYIQRAINFFDGLARMWGLDMHVQKTENQAMGQAVQGTFTTAAGSSFPTFDPKTSRPRTHYQYLEVYIFTQHQAEGLDAMIWSEILSYFSRLSPLPLTLSEKIRLVNSQLIPAVTYRLTAHPLPPRAIASLEDFIWRGLAKGSIMRLVSLKDRYASRARGGLAIKCLAQNVHTATIKFALRALHGRAPPSVGSLVTNSLCGPNQQSSDELQNSVMDAAHNLGLSFHSIWPWRPSAYEHLPVGSTITVKFKSDPSTGTVLRTSPSWANVQFADGVFSIPSDVHLTHHHPCHSFLNYSRPTHQFLIPTFLRPQETIPGCPDPPHGATICSMTVHGHLFDLPGVCHRLYEED